MRPQDVQPGDDCVNPPDTVLWRTLWLTTHHRNAIDALDFDPCALVPSAFDPLSFDPRAIREVPRARQRPVRTFKIVG
jgi:hypothetical protein